MNPGYADGGVPWVFSFGERSDMAAFSTEGASHTSLGQSAAPPQEFRTGEAKSPEGALYGIACR